MLIVPERAPEEAQAVALAKVEHVLQWEELKLQADGLKLVLPHHVCNLRTRGLLSNTQELRSATDPGGWRFLVADANGVVHAAVQTWHESDRWKASSVRTGTWATATKAAVVGVGLPDEAVLAYLWCRSTWTAALWLQATAGGEDKVVPLPWVKGLMPLSPIPPATYLKAMRERAKR
jgi:hypothetical protein